VGTVTDPPLAADAPALVPPAAPDADPDDAVAWLPAVPAVPATDPAPAPPDAADPAAVPADVPSLIALRETGPLDGAMTTSRSRADARISAGP
jgi:hypothetical protein